MNTITINGVEYVPIQPAGDLKIVVLQRGWVLVGKMTKEGNACYLNNASVIRIWGTTKGLGELAANGVTSKTVLDPCNGRVEFHELTMVLSISCEPSKWKL